MKLSDYTRPDAAVLAALGPQPGELRQFSDVTQLPATWAQASGPTTMPAALNSQIFCFTAPADPSGNYSQFLISASDGLHSVYLSGAVVAHTLLDETTGNFVGRAVSPAVFPASHTNFPRAFPLADGGFIVCGGTNSTNDTVAAVRYYPETNSWASIANLPAGGWCFGGGGVLADGRTLWIPAARRNPGLSTVTLNTQTWLYYDPVLNAWTQETHVGSVPASYQNGTPKSVHGGTDWVPLGGATNKFATRSATSGTWTVIDVAARTVATVTRGGAADISSTYGSPSWLLPSPGGALLVRQGTISTYSTATDSWGTVAPFMGLFSVVNVPSNSQFNGCGVKLKSGLFYLNNSNINAATLMLLGGYTPGGSVWARKL